MLSATAPQKLSRVTKWAYGAGDLGPAIVAGVRGFFFYYFLVNVALLPPNMAGLALGIIGVWDAVNDPIVGSLSDRTRSRWGRRRPWLLFGAIPFGLAYFMIWQVPPIDDLGRFWYYVIFGVLLDTAITAVNVPYGALTPELSSDYDERTSLNTYRFSFSILGGVTAIFLHNIIVDSFKASGQVLTGYTISAAIWAFFMVVPNFITFAFTRESQFVDDNAKRPGILEGIKIALSNKAFLWVTVIYLLSWLAIQFIQNNLLAYVELWIKAAEYFPFLIVSVQLSSFVFLLIWARVSQRLGKQRVYYIGMTFCVVVLSVLFFVQPGQVPLLFVLAILAGVGISLGYLIPWSMLPDVVEYEEMQTGQRREGVYYGFFVFLQKIGLSLGIAISGVVLSAAGYIRPAVEGGPIPPQPESALLALRVFVSFVPAAILLLSFLAVRAYPITRQKHIEMVAELARRRAESAAAAD